MMGQPRLAVEWLGGRGPERVVTPSVGAFLWKRVPERQKFQPRQVEVGRGLTRLVAVGRGLI